jgi:hypothetical protein
MALLAEGGSHLLVGSINMGPPDGGHPTVPSIDTLIRHASLACEAELI